MKRCLKCLVVLCSFLFISNIKAYNFEGLEITDEIINKGWEVISSKTSYLKEDFPCLAIRKKSDNFWFLFYTPDVYFTSYGTSAGYHVHYNNVTGFYYNIVNKTFTYGTLSNALTSSKIVLGFDLKDKEGKLIKEKDFEYVLTDNKKYNVTFHLNGGEVTDNNTEDKKKYNSDFTINITPNTLNDYINNLEITKEIHNFIGWYYDDNYDRKYEASDLIESDIDLYAKYERTESVQVTKLKHLFKDYNNISTNLITLIMLVTTALLNNILFVILIGSILIFVIYKIIIYLVKKIRDKK